MAAAGAMPLARPGALLLRGCVPEVLLQGAAAGPLHPRAAIHYP